MKENRLYVFTDAGICKDSLGLTLFNIFINPLGPVKTNKLEFFLNCPVKGMRSPFKLNYMNSRSPSVTHWVALMCMGIFDFMYQKSKIGLTDMFLYC